MHELVFTVGHSTHSQERLAGLLRDHKISALCDVRSTPYSRLNPQFNREEFKQRLREAGIAYVFLGKELGARSSDRSAYVNGKVQYDRLAKTPLFLGGLERIREGLKKHTIALMCAERDPLECHRSILVARWLVHLGIEVQHIHADSHLESHAEAMERLVTQLKLPQSDMFRNHQDVLDDAYRIQEARIAYTLDDSIGSGSIRSKVAAG